MYVGTTVFSQLMDFLPWPRFRVCVRRYRGDYKVKRFTCSEQFRVMAFAQLAFRESLRDIEACLRARRCKLYHMGIRGGVSRSNLAHANETRDWRIHADFAQILMARARQLYVDEDLGLDVDAAVYALDSTTIMLCLSLFPWARFRNGRGAIKLHALLNLRGSIPEFVLISDGRRSDVTAMDALVPLPGAYYVVDRGYFDFRRLFTWHRARAFFVTRSKSNTQFKRRYSRSVDKNTGIQCDQTIVFRQRASARAYPEPLRRIRYVDSQTHQRLVFLTNDFDLPALTIAKLYQARWQIELFFKWIKQHLRIQSFFATSENAVQTQIWIAVCVYLLVAIIKKELRLQQPSTQFYKY